MQVGDLVDVSYQAAVPAGLLLTPLGVTTAGQITVEACNVTGGSLSVTDLPIRVATFR